MTNGMMPDAWYMLWQIAVGEPDTGVAKIEVNAAREDIVTLVFEDGSKSSMIWHDGDWKQAEKLNQCPGDVAARDTL